MTDASILIPTYRHAALLLWSICSALDQEGVSVEVLVVGDGVQDASRDVIASFAKDPRVRFSDFPKGPRNGEAHRHVALQEAEGRIVCYLCDDDLLLRDHVAEMGRLLEDADFAHPVNIRFLADGGVWYFPWNYGRPEFREVARSRIGSVGLTGVSHTLEAYRRLPFGWRTTPEGMPTDHHMWLQWLDLPGLRAVMGERLTHLKLPDPSWRTLSEDERARAFAGWFRRSREPGFADELDEMVRTALMRGAEDYHLWARREQLEVEAMRATRTWRLRERAIQIGPLRALFARRRKAR